MTVSDGRLYAVHKSAPPIARLFYRGVPLRKAWNAAADAEIVKLDLKASAAKRPDLVVGFLEQHARPGQMVVVTSSDRKARGAHR